jgi:hypothetical protein
LIARALPNVALSRRQNDMHDEHDHDHDHGSHLTEVELRVRAIESILVAKGYVAQRRSIC